MCPVPWCSSMGPLSLQVTSLGSLTARWSHGISSEWVTGPAKIQGQGQLCCFSLPFAAGSNKEYVAFFNLSQGEQWGSGKCFHWFPSSIGWHSFQGFFFFLLPYNFLCMTECSLGMDHWWHKVNVGLAQNFAAWFKVCSWSQSFSTGSWGAVFRISRPQSQLTKSITEGQYDCRHWRCQIPGPIVRDDFRILHL